MNDHPVRQVTEGQCQRLAHERGGSGWPDDVHGLRLRLALCGLRPLLSQGAQEAREPEGVVPVQVRDEDEIHPAELERRAQELVLRSGARSGCGGGGGHVSGATHNSRGVATPR